MTKTTETINTRITGRAAIAHVEAHGGQLHKFADPTEGARVVTVAEAREIAGEDPSLIYVDTASRELAGYAVRVGKEVVMTGDDESALIEAAMERYDEDDFAVVGVTQGVLDAIEAGDDEPVLYRIGGTYEPRGGMYDVRPF